MKIRSWGYNIKQGLKNIFRNRMFTLASIATMTASLFLFGIFYALSMNLNHIVKQTEKTICITVFFDEGISEREIEKIGRDIRARSEVYYITYTSAEEAWEEYKQEHFKGYEHLIDGFKNDNPLANSASYEIYLNDITQQELMVEYLESMKGIRSVNASKAAAKNLVQVSQIVGIVSMIIVGVLIFVAIFLISNTITIGVTVRKDEISIMKLVGATDAFVKAPFMVEGVVIGMLGSAIPLGILYYAYDYVMTQLLAQKEIYLGNYELVEIGEIFGVLVPTILVIGVGIGFLGSYFTLKKHIKV